MWLGEEDAVAMAGGGAGAIKDRERGCSWVGGWMDEGRSEEGYCNGAADKVADGWRRRALLRTRFN